MKYKINKLLFFATIIFIISCKVNTKKNNDYFDIINDTSFIYNKTPDAFKSTIFNKTEPFWNVLLNNKIYISIYKQKENFHHLIKEFGTDSIYRYYYLSSILPISTPTYDSAEYDNKILIDIMIDSDMNHLDSMSRTFYNIHKLRDNSNQFNYHIEKYFEKLGEVESIINKMKVFNNFSIKDKQQYDLLKKIIFQLRISTLNLDHYMSHSLSSSVLNYNSVGEINNEKDLSVFEESLKSDKYYDKKLTTYWRKKNNQFLLEKIPYLKEELNKKGTFILYTRFPERKVFLYNVSIESGKIKLKEEYINKIYTWYHPLYGIWEPGIRM